MSAPNPNSQEGSDDAIKASSDQVLEGKHSRDKVSSQEASGVVNLQASTISELPVAPPGTIDLDIVTAMNQSATANYQEAGSIAKAPTVSTAQPVEVDVSRRHQEEELHRLLVLDRDGDETLGCMDSYTLLNILGAGGMGIVACAFDKSLHRKVAIKVMSERLARNERSRKRFLREARTAASINHPNVVTIHAVNDRNDIPYLVMEYVEGKTLHDRIRNTAPMAIEDVLRIGVQIAEGLAAAHRCGIIHRDVKPGNVLLENSVERVKITDFGLARIIVEHSDITSIDDVVGTPAYMSPEQVDGRELTSKSDLFSFGCVLYAMIAGRSPFYGPTSLICAQRVKELQPVPLQQLAPNIPPEFEQLVFKLLAKLPNDRPDSAQDVAQVLIDWAANSNLSSSHRLKTKLTAAPKPKSKKRYWLAGSCVFLGSIAAFAYLSVSRKPGIQPAIGLPAESIAHVLDDGKIYVSVQNGEISSLLAALAIAKPSTTIILGPGIYTGPFEVFDSERLQGLSIIGQPGAILRGSGDASVLRILNMANVKVSNLRFETSPKQIGINISGDCPGVQLEQIELVAISPKQTSVESIRFDFGASGAAASPISVANCEVHAGGVGIVIGSHDSSEAPVQHIRVHDCRIEAFSPEYGIPVVIQGPTRDIVIENNLLYRGFGGVSLRFDLDQQAERIQLRSNSLCQTTNAFFFNDSPTVQDIHIDNNVLALSEKLSTITGSVDRYQSWFTGNQWLAEVTPSDPVILGTFEQLPLTSVISISADSPDFMKPSPMSLKFLRGKSFNVN